MSECVSERGVRRGSADFGETVGMDMEMHEGMHHGEAAMAMAGGDGGDMPMPMDMNMPMYFTQSVKVTIFFKSWATSSTVQYMVALVAMFAFSMYGGHTYPYKKTQTHTNTR